MQIDKTFKIKEKYFNAILRYEKPFELRHEKVEPGSIIKLECDELGVSRLYKVVSCNILEKERWVRYIDNVDKSVDYWKAKCSKIKTYPWFDRTFKRVESDAFVCFLPKYAFLSIDSSYESSGVVLEWYDEFCWEYITKAPTYLIEIAEILEVK